MTIPPAELGPWLGVVAAPRPRPAPGALPLDGLRLALVDRLLAEAHAAQPDWLAAWQPVVADSAQLVTDTLRARLTDAAARSRAPARVVRLAAPVDDDLRVIRARLDSAGIPLETTVRSLPAGGLGADAFPRIGGAVEESWLALEAVVAGVLGEWAPRIGALARWRRDPAPLWIMTAVLLGAALLSGAWIGGYLPAPAWFAPVITWWWSLPWP